MTEQQIDMQDIYRSLWPMWCDRIITYAIDSSTTTEEKEKKIHAASAYLCTCDGYVEPLGACYKAQLVLVVMFQEAGVTPDG